MKLANGRGKGGSLVHMVLPLLLLRGPELRDLCTLCFPFLGEGYGGYDGKGAVERVVGAD